MSVGILLVTHPGIGLAMLNSAKRIVNNSALDVRCLDVPVDTDLDRINEVAEHLLQQLDQGEGVLILTDLFGATPNNIARGLVEKGHVAVLAGLNLPMLVRVFNYPSADLKAMCDTAVTGGSRGVHTCCLSESPE